MEIHLRVLDEEDGNVEVAIPTVRIMSNIIIDIPFM